MVAAMNRDSVPNLCRGEDGQCWEPPFIPACPVTREMLRVTCDNCGSSDIEYAFQLETGLAPYPVKDRHLQRCRLCGRIESFPLYDGNHWRNESRRRARPADKPWRPHFVLYEGRVPDGLPMIPTSDMPRLVASLRRQLDRAEREDLARRITD